MFDEPTRFARPTDQQLPGCVLTVAKRDEVIVWLVGEIDSSVALDLTQVVDDAAGTATRLVIDATRVTFCDSTLANFIGHAANAMEVVVRRPSRLVVDLLVTTGLYRHVVVRAGRVR